MTKYIYTSPDNQNYEFIIHNEYFIPANANASASIELCLLYDNSAQPYWDEPYCHEVFVYKQNNKLVVKWDQATISAYAHIVGYKEYIDRIIGLLNFS